MTALDFEISHRPDFALLVVRLSPGEAVYSEPSAMATMDASLQLKAGLRGGLMRAMGRALGGDSPMLTRYTATETPGEVTLAPGPPGDIVHHRMDGHRLLLQRGALLAHGRGVHVSGHFQGARGFFGGEGLVLLQAKGRGDLFFTSYGAIVAVDVAGDYLVDTGYVVAFEDTLQYRITTVPGLGLRSKLGSFLFGGEGLVCRFSGQGRLWIQTRTLQPFLSWVYPYRPQRRTRRN